MQSIYTFFGVILTDKTSCVVNEDEMGTTANDDALGTTCVS